MSPSAQKGQEGRCAVTRGWGTRSPRLSPAPCATSVSGTFQQVTNLLNIMDSESAKTDAAGTGPSMRQTLASAIIAEKAAAEPCAVMNALVCCLQVPEVRPPTPRRPPTPATAAAAVSVVAQPH